MYSLMVHAALGLLYQFSALLLEEYVLFEHTGVMLHFHFGTI